MSADTATTLRTVTTERDELPPRPDELSELLVLDGERQVIGTVQWHPVRYGPTRGSVAFNMGISLRHDARGRGHGSRAQALLTRHLFDRFPVHRVEAVTDIANTAEQRAPDFKMILRMALGQQICGAEETTADPNTASPAKPGSPRAAPVRESRKTGGAGA